jgi:hypothetical protein
MHRFFAVLLTLFGLLTPRGSAEIVTLELRERAVVSRKHVRISDIADISGGTDAFRQMIQQLDIDELPPSGKTRSCSRAQVAFRLRLAGISAEQFIITGATSTAIVPERRAIPVVEVEEAARQAVLRLLPREPGWDIRLVRPIAASMPELAEDEALQIDAQPLQQLRGPGRVQVNVTIRVDGEHRLSLPVYFEVRRLASSGTGESSVAVRSGDVVRMSVTLGNLKITGTGEALQTGRVGDLIRVRNVDSKVVVMGRVDGPKSVHIETPEP